MRHSISFFLLITTLFFVSCNSRYRTASPAGGANSLADNQVLDKAKSWMVLENSDEFGIRGAFLNKKLPRDFANEYAGAHGGIAIFDDSNKSVGAVLYITTDSKYIIFLLEELSDTIDKVVDIKVVIRTPRNKMLSISGKYKGDYVSHMLVITSAEIEAEQLSSTDAIFVFDMKNQKIIDINKEDVVLYNEEG